MFKFMFAFFLFIATAFAQSAFIGLPNFNQTVTKGSDLVVQVQRPNSLTGSEEVAVVIGLVSCTAGPCPSPSENMGNILYNGPFRPEYNVYSQPPYQNFTLQVPSSFSQGTASIQVAHVTLIGAGLYPFLETLNETITVL